MSFESERVKTLYFQGVVGISLLLLAIVAALGFYLAGTRLDQFTDPVTFIVDGVPELPLCEGESLMFRSIAVFNKDQTTFVNSSLVRVNEDGRYLTTVGQTTSPNLADQWLEFREGDRFPSEGWAEFTVRESGMQEPGYYQFRLSYNALDGTTTREDISFQVVSCE